MSELFDLHLCSIAQKVMGVHYIKAYHRVMLGQVLDFYENLPAPFSICITAQEALERQKHAMLSHKEIGEIEIRPTEYKEAQTTNRFDLILQSYDNEEYIKYAMTLGVLHKVKVPENRGYLDFDKLPKIILRNAIETDVICVKETFEKAGANLTVVPTQYADIHLAPIFSFFKG
jgi:hypothetical protein